MNKVFNAKILLFGEYGIIKDSKGLAMPFDTFNGQLKPSHSVNITSLLQDIVVHIKRSKILKKELNIVQMQKDIDEGLEFLSNIPQGYGLGSSGALCASLFSKYSYNYDREKSYDSEDLGYIQELLAIIESYYHGTSSGIDPLISFFNKTVLIKKGQQIEFIERPKIEEFGNFYLLDSGDNRKTSPLVHQFLKDCSDEKYMLGIEKFIILTDKLIENTLDLNKKEFLIHFNELSRNQYLYFDKMIPNSIRDIWLTGLESKEYFLKLCGAGGGGFFMLYAPEGKVPLSHTLIKLC